MTGLVIGRRWPPELLGSLPAPRRYRAGHKGAPESSPPSRSHQTSAGVELVVTRHRSGKARPIYEAVETTVDDAGGEVWGEEGGKVESVKIVELRILVVCVAFLTFVFVHKMTWKLRDVIVIIIKRGINIVAVLIVLWR